MNDENKTGDQAEAAGRAATPVQECKLCGHTHVGRCEEDAPNAQFSCACPGECPHGKHPAYCRECVPPQPPPVQECPHRLPQVPEMWREIFGYPGYEVSDLGRVRNPAGKVLKSFNNVIGGDKKRYV